MPVNVRFISLRQNNRRRAMILDFTCETVAICDRYLDEGVIIESSQDPPPQNAYQLYNKKDIVQLYSKVVESSHYYGYPSTRKLENEDYQRRDMRGTKETMNEHTFGFNQ